MKKNHLKTAAFLLCTVWLGAGVAVRGAECPSVTINAFDVGYYDATGFHHPTFENYLCGDLSSGEPPNRNWFVFNIPVLTQSVASAWLRIYTYDVAMPEFSEVFQLREVLTPIATLRTGGSGLTGIYADLGDGAIYGSSTFRREGAYQFRTIALGPDFLTKLAASSGGTLAIGGQVVTLDGISRNNEYLFAGSSLFTATNPSVQLLVTYSNASPLTIVEHPTSRSLPIGDGASFQVRTCGGGRPGYQWQRFGTNIVGATNPFLEVLNVTPADAGSYRVLVTDSLTTLTSVVATLTVNASAPTGSIYFNFGQSPSQAGESVMFCSSISGIPAPSYQWQLNGTNLPAQTGFCLHLPNLQAGQSGNYRLVASNVVGVFTSAPISLVVTQVPPSGSIYLASGSTLPPAGSSVTLCSGISGGPSPSLQWQFNGANLPGQINPCLFLSNVSSNQSGSYRLVASNSVGAWTSAPIALAVQYYAPTGSIYFANGQSPTAAGSYVLLCSSISAAPAPFYQWQFNGVPLAGQNGSCLERFNVSTNQAGLYRVVASNSVGVFTSAPIALAVDYFAPTGSIYFSSGQSPAPAGSYVRFCSTIVGGPLPSYQWQLNGANLPGQLGPCLELPNLSSNNAGLYRLIANNNLGAFTSAPIALAVSYIAPSGSISPSGTVPPVAVGSSLTICASILGVPYPSFQWQLNGVDLPGQNYSCLTLQNAQINQSGNYRLIASNAAGSFTSAVAVVSVVNTAPTATIYLSTGRTPATVGSTLVLCSSVSGGPAPTLQWQFNGTNLPGQISSCLALSDVQTNQSGAYTIVASNIVGVVTSQVAQVTIIEPVPVLAYLSGLVPVAIGSYQYFCSLVSLPEPATLQWQFNGTNIVDATNFCFYVYPVDLDDVGDYTIVATTASGSYTSPPVALTYYYAPPILAAPVLYFGSYSVLVGADVSLYAGHSGSPSAIQWLFNGAELAGQTNYSLALLGITTNQAGAYWFTASNASGMTTSSVVTLTVSYQPPFFAEVPASQSVVEGTTARLRSYAPAGPPPVYFLQRDGTNVAVPFTYEGCCSLGAGGFSLLDTTFGDAGNYRIIASNFLGMATSTVATLTVTPAGPLDRWTQRNPLPQSQPLLAVAHGTNQFVAVGERGTILTSPDGSNWTLQNRRADLPLHGVAYGNGLFVAVGDGGIVLSSADGTNWAYRYTAAATELNAITYAAGRFVVVGSAPGLSTLVMHSTDGVNWERIPLNGFYAQRCVAYGNGVFIAAGSSSIMSSPDGTNWVLEQTVNREIESVTHAEGQFVAVGDDGLILVSLDGSFWLVRPSQTPRRLLGVTYGAGRFVIAGSRGIMLTSTETMTWTGVTSGTPDRLETIDFSGGLFVAAGENGTILTSTNGLDWTKRNFGVTRDLDGMEVANGLVVVVGKGGSILTSTNGVDYATPDAGVTNDLHGVTWGGGRWVAVGEPGIILTSSNAVDWVSHVSGTTNSLKDGTYANGQWIVVGTQGTVVRSTDGANWETTFVFPPYDLNDVAYGNGMFLVVGDGPGGANGSLYMSFDGVGWNRVNFNPSKNLRGITFVNGLFMIAANDGIVFTTSNGVQFNTSHPFGGNLRAVTWAHGLWIVVGNNGQISTSPDRIIWTRRASRTFENMHQVALLDGKLLVIGNRGTILQSGRFVTELEPPVFMPGVGFRFPFKGVLNQAYQVEASTNLINWTSLRTFTNMLPSDVFIDTDALQYPRRFYRLVEP